MELAYADTQRNPFFEARTDGLRIVHREGLAPEDVAALIVAHKKNVALGRDACEHWGPGSTVSRVTLAAPGRPPADVAVKWNPWRGPRRALSDWAFGSRAARAAAGAERLVSFALLAPVTLAVVERRRFGCVVESFLLTEFLDGALPLPAVMPELRANPARRRRVAERLGELIGTLHAADLDHSDLKHSNLMLTPEDEIVLLDLDVLEPPRRATWRRRVRALGQLEAYTLDLYDGVPRMDRARFLRGYHRCDPTTRAQTDALVADVRAWVERRLATWAKKDRSDHYHFPLAPREGASPQAPAAPADPPTGSDD
jgi:hypothetical protein